MKEKLIDYLIHIAYEHRTNNFCTSYKEAEECIEKNVLQSFDKFYDVGRYDTIHEILAVVQRMEK